MYESPSHLRVSACAERFPAFVIARLDDLSTESADRVQLGSGRSIHGEDLARHARFVGSERDPLRGIARADRPDSLAAPLIGKQTHGVICAANLERTDGLEAFQLQIDLGRTIVIKTDERRADRGFIDVFDRIVDHSRGNVALRNCVFHGEWVGCQGKSWYLR